MSCLIYVLICLSLHACNARQLGVIGERTSIQVPSIDRVTALNKDIGNAEVHKIEKAKEKTLEGSSSANTMKGMESNDENNKGYETKAPSFAEVLQEASKKEGWKRQERSTMGSVPHDVEETVKSKEDDIVEDIVAMDYAQPHRKPPIHNIKP
ncbi:hypothetical protein LguiA_034160 [Lonicera macranthoides]